MGNSTGLTQSAAEATLEGIKTIKDNQDEIKDAFDKAKLMHSHAQQSMEELFETSGAKAIFEGGAKAARQEIAKVVPVRGQCDSQMKYLGDVLAQKKYERYLYARGLFEVCLHDVLKAELLKKALEADAKYGTTEMLMEKIMNGLETHASQTN